MKAITTLLVLLSLVSCVEERAAIEDAVNNGPEDRSQELFPGYDSGEPVDIESYSVGSTWYKRMVLTRERTKRIVFVGGRFLENHAKKPDNYDYTHKASYVDSINSYYFTDNLKPMFGIAGDHMNTIALLDFEYIGYSALALPIRKNMSWTEMFSIEHPEFEGAGTPEYMLGHRWPYLGRSVGALFDIAIICLAEDEIADDDHVLVDHLQYSDMAIKYVFNTCQNATNPEEAAAQMQQVINAFDWESVE